MTSEGDGINGDGGSITTGVAPQPISSRPSNQSAPTMLAPHAHAAQHPMSSLLRSPSGTATPTGSILLNKTGSSPGSRTTSPPPASSVLLQAPNDSPSLLDPSKSARTPSPILSTGSPSFTMPFATSGQGTDSSTASPLPLGQASPLQQPHLTSIDTGSAIADDSLKASKSSSPHCHFAPLPKVDQDHRPSTRRNSSVTSSNRVKPFIAHSSAAPAVEPTDNYSTQLDGEHLGRALRGLSLQPSPRQSRSRGQGGSGHVSADRSSSPSPSRRGQSATTGERPSFNYPTSTGSGHSSRTHSPAMSRRASTDAMSVHYIEGTSGTNASGISSSGPRDTATALHGQQSLPPRLIRRESSHSRERERQMYENKERELEFERQRMREHKMEEREKSASRTTSPVGGGASSTSSGVVSDGRPKPMFVEPTAEERVKPLRRATNEEIVEIEPGEERNKESDELEEVVEEDEDEGVNDDIDDDDDEVDGDEDDNEERDGDDQDDNGDEDGDEEDEEQEQEAAAERATSRGAAVEIDGHTTRQVVLQRPHASSNRRLSQPGLTRPVSSHLLSVKQTSTVTSRGSGAGSSNVKHTPTTADDAQARNHGMNTSSSTKGHRLPSQIQQNDAAVDGTTMPDQANLVHDHYQRRAQRQQQHFSEIHLAPATRTSVVTTTTTTTVHFAPILLPRSSSIRERTSSFSGAVQTNSGTQQEATTLLDLIERQEPGLETAEQGNITELDPKLYPLSQTSYPGGLKQFKLKLGNLDGIFYEAGQEHHQRSSQSFGNVANSDTVVSSSAAHKGKGKVMAAATGRDPLQQRWMSTAKVRKPSESQAALSDAAFDIDQDTTMTDNVREPSTGPPPRKRPRESPPSPAADLVDPLSFGATPAERANVDLAALSPGSAHANAASLPSPHLSPPSPVPTSAGDLGNKTFTIDDANFDIERDFDSDNHQQFDFGSGHALSSLMYLPDLVKTFDQLPAQLQSYLIFNLLKRSSVPVLQTINNIIAPALRRDFLTDLPPELGVHVLGFLDHRSLCRAAVVCKSWRKLTDGEWRVWKQRLIQDGLWIGDGSEERAAAEIVSGRKENLFLKRWRAGIWEAPPLTSWSGKTEDVFTPAVDELERSNVAGPTGRRMSNVRLASPSSSREASPFGHLNHFTHPYKTLYRRRHTVRQNWQTKTPNRTSFSSNSNNVITSLQFDKDKVVSASDDHSINVFDTRTGARKARLSDHDGGVWALQYIGNVLVSGSTDRTVRVWDLDRAKCTHTFVGHTSTVRCLQIVEPENVNPDINGEPIWEPEFPVIVTGSRDWSLRVWILPLPGRSPEWHPVVPLSPTDDNIDADDNPYHLRHLAGHRHAVRALAAQGRTLVSGSYDCSVRVWDIMTGECKHRLQGHTQKVYSVVYDHHRQQCASGSMDGTVRLWSTNTGECIVMLDGHSSLVGLLGLSHRHLVSAAADSTLRVWDPSTGEHKHTLAAHSGAITCFQHDAHKVVSGSDGTLKMWDVNDGSFKRDLITGLTGVWQVAFDDRFCVAAVQRGGQSEFEVMDFGGVDSDDEREDCNTRMDDNEIKSEEESESEFGFLPAQRVPRLATQQHRRSDAHGRSASRNLRGYTTSRSGNSGSDQRGRVVRRLVSTRNLAAAAAATASNTINTTTTTATQTPTNDSSRLIPPNAPRLGALDDDEVGVSAVGSSSTRMNVDEEDEDSFDAH
ncbi:SCF ubiquitin ligase complex subunit cdc4 [Microbotryomycetes sp. JL221]|nr:SCF ubiquitin ligase complex subunit cdc4 [Microbotryomycetes sp. JL221]